MSAGALMKHAWVVWNEKALESMRVDFLGYKCLSCDRRIRSPSQHVVLPTDLCMGRNDYHVRDDGSFGPGLTTKHELKSVLAELGDADLAGDIAATLATRLQYLKDRELPMLKGSGFIVVNPKEPRFAGEEFADFEDAKNEGSNIAYKDGVAIVYAPVLVMRPKRETANAQPSELLKQLGLPKGQAIGAGAAIAGGTPEGEDQVVAGG